MFLPAAHLTEKPENAEQLVQYLKDISLGNIEPGEKVTFPFIKMQSVLYFTMFYVCCV